VLTCLLRSFAQILTDTHVLNGDLGQRRERYGFPESPSDLALGTIGGGNHFAELQAVESVARRGGLLRPSTSIAIGCACSSTRARAAWARRSSGNSCTTQTGSLMPRRSVFGTQLTTNAEARMWSVF
jgi:tRNA-splicing ligase RtcB